MLNVDGLTKFEYKEMFKNFGITYAKKPTCPWLISVTFGIS